MSVTIGETLAFLKKCKQDKPLYLLGRGSASSHLRSWRGSYEHLSISPNVGGEITVGEFTKALGAMLGQTITGYKGGDYIVRADTELYADAWSEYTDHRIIGGTEYRASVDLNIEMENPKRGWEHCDE